MLIDWFTVVAQVVNFLVLAWLLKRFLYKPVLDALDAREKRIADGLAEAERTRTEARKEKEAFQRKNETFERERETLRRQAVAEAGAERERLFENARQAAEIGAARRRDALQNEAQAQEHTLRALVRGEVFAVARQALRDLASASLEERLAEAFITRLRSLDDDARRGLEGALRGASGPAVVRSAFALPEAQQEAVRQALKEVLAADIPVRFEVDPDRIGGLELRANGWKVAWSLDDYLASLEKAATSLLNGEKA